MQREWVRRLNAHPVAAVGTVPPVPDRKKLNAFISNFSKKNLDGAAELGGRVTPQRLLEFAQSRSREALQGPEFNAHTVYIVGAETFELLPEGSRFNLLYTTDTLIAYPDSTVYTADSLQLDDSAGTNYYGFPIQIPCYTDLQRKSHPVGVFLSSHKDEISYRNICIILHRVRPDIHIRYISADGADAIFNGAVQVFVGAIWIMCWMHVYIKNVIIIANKIPSHENAASNEVRMTQKKQMLSVFKVTHQARRQAEFEAMAVLFRGAYIFSGTVDGEVQKAAISLYNSWLAPTSRRSNFWAGAAHGHQINQCGNENKHKEYKSHQGGLPQKSVLAKFNDHTTSWTLAESRERAVGFVNYVPFARAIVVPANAWIKGYTIYKDSARTKAGRNKESDEGWLITTNKRAGGLGGGWVEASAIEPADNTWTFVVCCKKLTPALFRDGGAAGGDLRAEQITTKARVIIDTWEAASWTTAQELYDYGNNYFIVTAVLSGPEAAGAVHQNFEGSNFGGLCCQCEVCTRELVCEHVVAVRLMLGDVTLPVQYASFKGQKKRERGRPRSGTGNGVRYGSGFTDSDSE